MKPIIFSDVLSFGHTTGTVAKEFGQPKFQLVGDPDEVLADDLRLGMERRYQEITQFCEVYGLPVSKACCLEIVELLKSRDTSKGKWLQGPTTELCKRLKAELESKRGLMFPPERARYYESAHLFGEEVRDSFPSANYDVEEAAKCFALGRTTATVLHLMRVLEIGLAGICKALKVPYDEASWNTLLNQLQKKWKLIEARKNKPKSWKKDRQFYGEVFVEFDHLKDAWRNHAMHARAQYDEERASNVLDHVQRLMRHLATKLKE